jgi:ferritin-like metal-binding protein YciE
MATGAESTRSLYAIALRNTHALEMQALQIMERQVERIQNYPEMERILRRHIQETHAQRDRIDEALNEIGESPSTLKEAVLGFVGNVAALAHSPFEDEILKNTYANHAFENFEIAAYTSLLVITEAAGQTRHISAFQQSLQEEKTTAQLIHDAIQPITRKYIELEARGAKADR